MKRVRWLRASLPISLKTLISKFRLHIFAQGMASGFLLDRVRERFIEGRYIERKEYKEISVDPFGREEIFQRVNFNQIEFAVFSDISIIEIFDSPRCIQSFICRLLEICDFNLIVAPQPVNLLKWVEKIQLLVTCPLVVESIQIAGLELADGVAGKVLLTGERDVRATLGKITGDKEFTTENLRVRIPLSGKNIPVSLGASCSARFPNGALDSLLPLLRKSLLLL